MPSFVTNDAVATYVKDVLAKAPPENLKPFWTAIVAAANSQAYQFIAQYFQQIGYSAAQVAQWDFGASFQTRLAGYFATLRVYPESQADLAAVDPRKELVGDKQLGIPGAMLIVDDEIVDPDGTRGQVSTGPIDTSDDLFVPHNPDDSRLGQVTRL